MTANEEAALLNKPRHDEESLVVTSDAPVSQLALLSLLLSSFLANADESFIFTTGSDVAAALGASELTSWLITAYNLGYTAALPLYGQICDLAGPKKSIILALTLYGFGCMMAGLSSSIYPVLAGRVLSGIGGSGMVELVSVLVNDMGGIHQVAVLRSYVTTASMLGMNCGAPLGAILTDRIGWKWAFLIHAPFAVLCIVCIAFTLSIPRKHIVNDRSYGAINDQKKKQEVKSNLKKFDIVGLVLVMTALVCFLGLIQVVPKERIENKTTILIILGAIFLIASVAFLVNEAYVAQCPFIPLSLFKPHNLGLVYVCQLFIGLANSSMIPIISDYWVRAYGFSATEGTLCWIPATIGLGLGSLVTGRLIQRLCRYLVFTKVGLTIAVSSFALILTRWVFYEPMTWEVLYTAPAFFGMGMTLSSQFVALSAAKPAQNVATSVTTFYLSQQIGFMAGITFSESLIRSSLENRLIAEFGNSIRGHKLIRTILNHRRSLAFVPPEFHRNVQMIIRESYYVAPVITIISLLLVFFICLRQREVKSR